MTRLSFQNYQVITQTTPQTDKAAILNVERPLTYLHKHTLSLINWAHNIL